MKKVCGAVAVGASVYRQVPTRRPLMHSPLSIKAKYGSVCGGGVESGNWHTLVEKIGKGREGGGERCGCSSGGTDGVGGESSTCRGSGGRSFNYMHLLGILPGKKQNGPGRAVAGN